MQRLSTKNFDHYLLEGWPPTNDDRGVNNMLWMYKKKHQDQPEMAVRYFMKEIERVYPEVVARELARLLMPWQPKARCMKAGVGGKPYVISKDVGNYVPFNEMNPSELVARILDGTYRGLGLLCVHNLIVANYDMHLGNVGVDKHHHVVNIDGDLAFILYQKSNGRIDPFSSNQLHRAEFIQMLLSQPLTVKTISDLPFVNDRYLLNWLDSINHFEVKAPYFSSVLVKHDAFRAEVGIAVLRYLLLPDRLIVHLINSCTDGNVDAANFLTKVVLSQIHHLKKAMLGDEDFCQYLFSELAKEEAEKYWQCLEVFHTNSKQSLISNAQVKKEDIFKQLTIVRELASHSSTLVLEDLFVDVPGAVEPLSVQVPLRKFIQHIQSQYGTDKVSSIHQQNPRLFMEEYVKLNMDALALLDMIPTVAERFVRRMNAFRMDDVGSFLNDFFSNSSYSFGIYALLVRRANILSMHDSRLLYKYICNELILPFVTLLINLSPKLISYDKMLFSLDTQFYDYTISLDLACDVLGCRLEDFDDGSVLLSMICQTPVLPIASKNHLMVALILTGKVKTYELRLRVLLDVYHYYLYHDGVMVVNFSGLKNDDPSHVYFIKLFQQKVSSFEYIEKKEYQELIEGFTKLLMVTSNVMLKENINLLIKNIHDHCQSSKVSLALNSNRLFVGAAEPVVSCGAVNVVQAHQALV